MKHNELTARLNGNQVGDEHSLADEKDAKASGLVIVFGYSDDNCELRGAIHDEIGCYNGGKILFNSKGVVNEPDDQEQEVLEKFGVFEHFHKSASQFEAVWCETKDGPPWTYKAAFPHSTFDVMEDGEVFCRGIVFNLEEALNHTLGKAGKTICKGDGES